MNKNIIEKIKNSPHLPGIYIFSNKKEIVYVGKANDLNQRLKSYVDISIRKNESISKYANNLK